MSMLDVGALVCEDEEELFLRIYGLKERTGDDDIGTEGSICIDLRTLAHVDIISIERVTSRESRECRAVE